MTKVENIAIKTSEIKIIFKMPGEFSSFCFIVEI
jgi:hypothetical protein